MIGPATFFWQSGSIPSASRCVYEMASSAQNRPRSNLHRFFLDFASIFVDFRKICRGISFEPPVTKAQNRNLKKESRDPARASWLLRGAVAYYCSHFLRNDFRTLDVQPLFIAYPQAHLVYLREFALCYERHPESVRTVPWLCPAGCDSVSAASAGVFQARLLPSVICFFNLGKNRP